MRRSGCVSGSAADVSVSGVGTVPVSARLTASVRLSVPVPVSVTDAGQSVPVPGRTPPAFPTQDASSSMVSDAAADSHGKAVIFKAIPFTEIPPSGMHGSGSTAFFAVR